MRKLFLFFIAVFLIIFKTNFIAKADFNQSLIDYNTFLEQYRNSYQLYQKNKNIFLTYKTLNSEAEALTSTKLMLEKKDDVLISYFSLLKSKTEETDGINNFFKSLNQNTISLRENYLYDHKNSISAVNSINDIVQKSKEIDDQKTDIQNDANRIVGRILVGSLEKYDKELLSNINEINQILSEIKSRGNNTTKLERWILETNNKYQLASSKLSESSLNFENLGQTENYKDEEDYAQAKKTILEAKQYYKEAYFNLKEAILEIKKGNYN